MTSFEERIYQLGAEALAEQERQVAEIRGRGSTLLAAGAVIASLLTKPAFHGDHPNHPLERAATAAGLLGAGGLLIIVALLLRPYWLGFGVSAPETVRALWDKGMIHQPMVDLALANAFEEQRLANAKVVRQLVRLLAVALSALVLEAAGLAAAAALAS